MRPSTPMMVLSAWESMAFDAFTSRVLKLAVQRLVYRAALSSPNAPNQPAIDHVRNSVLVTLSEVLHQYLTLLAKTAADQANESGRTEVTAWDALGALEHLGVDLEDVRMWAIDGKSELMGSSEVGLVDAGRALSDALGPNPEAPAVSLLSYEALSSQELAELEHASQTSQASSDSPHPSDRDGSSSDYDDPAIGHRRKLRRLQEDSEMGDGHRPSLPTYDELFAEDAEDRQQSAYGWRNTSVIPDFVPPFFPPFPGMEAERAPPFQRQDAGALISSSGDRIQELETNPPVNLSGYVVEDPWRVAKPFSSSDFGRTNLPTTLPSLDPSGSEASPSNRARPLVSQISPPSSLPVLREIYRVVPKQHRLRPNLKRKQAAASIGVVETAADSIFGNVPLAQPRFTRKSAGWLPYPPPKSEGIDKAPPIPPLHPFNTHLPISLTSAVPHFSTPEPTPLAAAPFSRSVPNTLPGLVRAMNGTNPTLFSRTLRMGPPGPLQSNGASGEYILEEDPAAPNPDGGMVDRPRYFKWPFDWPSKDHTISDLPRSRMTSPVAAFMPSLPPIPGSAAVANFPSRSNTAMSPPPLPSQPMQKRHSITLKLGSGSGSKGSPSV